MLILSTFEFTRNLIKRPRLITFSLITTRKALLLQMSAKQKKTGAYNLYTRVKSYTFLA